MVHVLLTVE